MEAVAGWRFGSLALLADAGHMVTDGAAQGLALLAAWIAARPPSPRHSYGLGRVELLAAGINALTMLAVVFGIGWEAWARFQTPRAIDGGMVGAVAVLGLLVNLGVARILVGGRDNMNVRGAYLHVLGDLVLASSLRLLREALHGLLDGVPFSVSLPELGRELASIPGVLEVHDLHVWDLSGERTAVSAHVRMNGLAEWPAVLAELQARTQAHGIEHATFQPELPTWSLIERRD
ncbi:MAG: cation diffusion facilitator family transporter [Sulfurisoma sp.]|nr:cation diffusion facilitator family transporter [Sulfurisoma sp.]